MRTQPLKGRIGYWLRQFGDSAEGTLPNILSTITTLAGGSCLCLKVADGTAWVGSYDAATPVNSIGDLVALATQCEAAGVAFLPVVVPRGGPGEAAFHAAIAVACGALMVDVEPYTGFFDRAPLDQIPVYWQALRAASGDAYLMIQPDPRHAGWVDGKVSESFPYFNAFCCQHYVGWNAVGWTNLNYEVTVVNYLLTLGKDVYVTIYGADPSFPGSQQLPTQFWEAVRPNVLGLCVFAFGPMNAAQLGAIAAVSKPVPVPDPVGPQPKPKPQPTPQLRDQLALWSASNAADLLDPDLADADVLPRVALTAQGILDAIGGKP